MSHEQEPTSVERLYHTNNRKDLDGKNGARQRWYKSARLVKFKPNDNPVKRYCKELIHSRFIGETSNITDGRTDHSEDCHVINMGGILKALDCTIRRRGKLLNANDPEILENLEFAALKRVASAEHKGKKFASLLRDKDRFIEIYNKRGVISDQLHHEDYWGTRQQLLAGKVIADWIDVDSGPLDPLFGVLLCPTAGRTGAGDSCLMHHMLFDGNGPFAFHSAVHDGFGYLINFHNTGPGYDYLGASTFFSKHSCMAGQMDGLLFWERLLDKKQKKKIGDIFM